jgi:hypothetical protein
LEKLAKEYWKMGGLPEWESLKKAIRRTKCKGATCMILNILDASEAVEESVVDGLAMKAPAPGAKTPMLIPS